jgi:putative glutamine amidotransferase
MGADRITEYEDAVRAAGGEPLPLAPDVARVAGDLAALDGLVLSGGADIDPSHWGETPHPLTELAAPERDAYELAIARASMERRVPTLAICRGIQIANVAFGGSLHQHVPDIAGDAIPHAPPGEDGRTLRGVIDAHRVTTMAGSRLARIVGPVIATGSRHHQSLHRIAGPFRVVAQTDDGIVEAIELREAAPFWLGVQWHPESTVALDGGASRAIFHALIDATGPSAKGRPR